MKYNVKNSIRFNYKVYLLTGIVVDTTDYLTYKVLKSSGCTPKNRIYYD